MTNPYKLQLQRELDLLIKRKIGLRRVLRMGPLAFSGDALDRRRGMESARLELAAAERRHAQLRHELGIAEPTGPVSLTPRPHEAAALARSKAKVTPSVRTAPAYIRKVVRPGVD
jgi:hypothetical protein